MIQKKKNLKFRKISEKVKKLGGTITASNAQLERLFNEQHIKYVMSLEDQLQEDKAHLLLKQNTIQYMEEELGAKELRIKQFEEEVQSLKEDLLMYRKLNDILNKIRIKHNITDLQEFKNDL